MSCWFKCLLCTHNTCDFFLRIIWGTEDTTIALHFNMVENGSSCAYSPAGYWLWRLIHTFKHCTMITNPGCHQVPIVLPGPGWWAGILSRNHHNCSSCWSVTNCTWDIVARNRVKWSSICLTSSYVQCPMQESSSMLYPSSEGGVLWLFWQTEMVRSTSFFVIRTSSCPSSIQ